MNGFIIKTRLRVLPSPAVVTHFGLPDACREIRRVPGLYLNPVVHNQRLWVHLPLFQNEKDAKAALPQILKIISNLEIVDKIEKPIPYKSIDKKMNVARMTKPIFLVSPPRSGSTLLYEILAASPEFWQIGGESQQLIEGIPELNPAYRNFESQELNACDLTLRAKAKLMSGLSWSLRNSRHDLFLKSPRAWNKQIRYIDKTPANALRIPFLHKLFGDARFIYLYRDPRETIYSLSECWRDSFFHYYLRLPDWPRKIWTEPLIPGWRKTSLLSYEEIATLQVKHSHNRIMSELQKLPSEQHTTVTFEELISNPAETVRRLCRFCEIPFDKAVQKRSEKPLAASGSTRTEFSPEKWKKNRRKIETALPLLGDVNSRFDLFRRECER